MTLDEARVIYEKKLYLCLIGMPPDTVYFRFKKHINALYYTTATLIENILFHPNRYQYNKEGCVSSISGRMGYIKINERESRVEISVDRYTGRFGIITIPTRINLSRIAPKTIWIVISSLLLKVVLISPSMIKNISL